MSGFYYFICKISMGNKCCKNDSKLGDYPKNEEERRAMKRPFVAGTTPKRYTTLYSVWTFNLEKSTIGAHVVCPRINHSVMARTKIHHTNPSHSWPQRERTICVCASRLTTSHTVMVLTVSWISEHDTSSISILLIISSTRCLSSRKLLINLNFGLSI